MKLILSWSILFIFPLTTDSEAQNNTSEQTVIICTGKYSKRYHNSICRGMKACKGERQTVSLSDAKKMGLTKCGYCYNS